MFIRIAMFASVFAASANAQPFSRTLIQTTDSHSAAPIEIRSQDIAPDFAAGWSVRLKRLQGGKQDGVDLLVVNNGNIEITLIPTRGLGVLSVRQGDFRLGWDSPVKEVVHPKYIQLQARGGLGWLDGFNEWMVRCGLENNGQAGQDKFINNVGDEATMDLTLHGKIANIPASHVEVRYEKSPKPRILILGQVNEKMLFGPKLELRTQLITEPGSTRFEIVDEVVNAGAQPQEFQMLYHANFGRPLLEEGAEFLAPLEKVTPYNARAAEELDVWNRYLGPQTGYVERVYLLKPLADDNGRTIIALKNKAGNRAASMSYSVKELPWLTLWKNTGAIEDGYVTGLEPGTNYPNRRAIERKAGRVPVLEGGKSYRMAIEYDIHTGSKDVGDVASRIAAIQKKKAVVLDKSPAN